MVSNINTIIFFSRDYGGVQAIIPVVETLTNHDFIKTVVLSYENSGELFHNVGIETRAIPSIDNEEKKESYFDKIIRKYKPCMVVTGTSRISKGEIRTPEQTLTKVARRSGIKVIAVLDFWGFYEERFPRLNGKFVKDYLPNIVCCLDKQCESDLIALGMPIQNLKITHNPHIDRVISWVTNEKKNQNNARALNVLYVSQPIRENGLAEELGFDQESNFFALLSVFEKEPWFDREVTIWLWIHPKETQVNWGSIISQNNQRFSDGGNHVSIVHDTNKSYDIFNKLDLVCSYYSTVLYDAIYFSVPCISISIGKKSGATNSLLITNQLGLSRSISTTDELVRFINKSDFQQLKYELSEKISILKKKQIFISDGSATNRVVEEIESNLT